MLKVRRTLILAAGFTALTLAPTGAMFASTALAQTMGEYGATVGSSASSAGSMGGSIGSGTGGGGLNMGVATGSPQPDVVTGHGPPRTIIIGGDDTSQYAHNPTRQDDQDDAAGDDWTEVR